MAQSLTFKETLLHNAGVGVEKIIVLKGLPKKHVSISELIGLMYNVGVEKPQHVQFWVPRTDSTGKDRRAYITFHDAQSATKARNIFHPDRNRGFESKIKPWWRKSLAAYRFSVPTDLHDYIVPWSHRMQNVRPSSVDDWPADHAGASSSVGAMKSLADRIDADPSSNRRWEPNENYDAAAYVRHESPQDSPLLHRLAPATPPAIQDVTELSQSEKLSPFLRLSSPTSALDLPSSALRVTRPSAADFLTPPPSQLDEQPDSGVSPVDAEQQAPSRMLSPLPISQPVPHRAIDCGDGSAEAQYLREELKQVHVRLDTQSVRLHQSETRISELESELAAFKARLAYLNLPMIPRPNKRHSEGGGEDIVQKRPRLESPPLKMPSEENVNPPVALAGKFESETTDRSMFAPLPPDDAALRALVLPSLLEAFKQMDNIIRNALRSAPT